MSAVDQGELPRLDDAALLAAAERREEGRLGGGPIRIAEPRFVDVRVGFVNHGFRRIDKSHGERGRESTWSFDKKVSPGG